MLLSFFTTVLLKWSHIQLNTCRICKQKRQELLPLPNHLLLTLTQELVEFFSAIFSQYSANPWTKCHTEQSNIFERNIYNNYFYMWQGSVLLIINNWGFLTTETCTKIKSALLRTALSLDYKGWNICKTELTTSV